MVKCIYIFFLCMGPTLIPMVTHAQEDKLNPEESSEVFLEAYSDEFQEKFFEALKQKGIENYDRAINLLLECKQFKINNAAVDYELAKAYLASKDYVLAQKYALSTLAARPGDYWVLNTVVTIFSLQGTDLDAIKQQLPIKNTELRKNLVMIYYEQQNYEAALHILNGMERSKFFKDLTIKIEDSIRSKQEVTMENTLEGQAKPKVSNPIDNHIKLISELLNKGNYMEVEAQSMEALENFPSQPFFYYAYGLALNKRAQYKEALKILELGLDFILDDEVLANNIYKELANAYTALGNSSKAKMYLSKIKPGL